MNTLKELTEHHAISLQSPFRVAEFHCTGTHIHIIAALSPLLTYQSNNKQAGSQLRYLCCAVGTHTLLLSEGPKAPQTLAAINSSKRRTVRGTSKNMSGFQKVQRFAKQNCPGRRITLRTCSESFN